jgi:phage shock protein PspC (stress-responsive transcriptional regulator)
MGVENKVNTGSKFLRVLMIWINLFFFISIVQNYLILYFFMRRNNESFSHKMQNIFYVWPVKPYFIE